MEEESIKKECLIVNEEKSLSKGNRRTMIETRKGPAYDRISFLKRGDWSGEKMEKKRGKGEMITEELEKEGRKRQGAKWMEKIMTSKHVQEIQEYIGKGEKIASYLEKDEKLGKEDNGNHGKLEIRKMDKMK